MKLKKFKKTILRNEVIEILIFFDSTGDIRNFENFFINLNSFYLLYMLFA